MLLAKKMFLEMIKVLDNPVDRFILLAVYDGMKKEEIATLKVEDIDFTAGVIRAGEKTIAMDESMVKVARDTVEEDTYYKNGEYDQTNTSYKLNMASPYVVKLKPTKANGNGLENIKVSGMKKRIESLLNSLDGGVTSKDLALSGAINKLKENNVPCKVLDIDSSLKKMGYNLSAYKIYNTLLEMNGEK